MTDQTEIIVTLLKELIDKNGPEYLLEKPYDAYKELNRYMEADNAVTAAMLCFLVCGLVSDAEKGCEPENFVDPENWVYVVRAAEESGCLDLIAYRGEQAVALDPDGNALCWSANDQDIGETDAEQLIIAAHCVA